MSWQNILNGRQIAADIEEKLVNQGEALRGGISRIYFSLSSEWKPFHGISERFWKSTFDFTEIVNKYELKRVTVCQIVRFISQFSLKLHLQF